MDDSCSWMLEVFFLFPQMPPSHMINCKCFFFVFVVVAFAMAVTVVVIVRLDACIFVH